MVGVAFLAPLIYAQADGTPLWHKESQQKVIISPSLFTSHSSLVICHSSFVTRHYLLLFGHFLHLFPCLYFLQHSFFFAQE